MELIEALPAQDLQTLHYYLSRYGGSGEVSREMCIENIPYFLRFWAEAKEPFYRAFGNQFILKQEICFTKGMDELEAEMDAQVYYGPIAAQKFRLGFANAVKLLHLTQSEICSLTDFVEDLTLLAKNVYEGKSITIKGIDTVDGYPLLVNSGCKVVKMLGKICKAIGYKCKLYKCTQCGYVSQHPKCMCCGSEEEIVEIDGFEAFRTAHSQVLNQKVVKGNLCLSIHPMDFVTMSDNSSGWDSCMTWMDRPGDFRLGTIEMMNSANIVMAYIEAKNPMSIGDNFTWNNKRWRQLLVVTPELLLGNKQYPYMNDMVQGTALQWMRKLAQTIPGFGPYDDTAVNIRNAATNKIGNQSIYVNLFFNYMYNDIYDLRLGFLKVNLIKDTIRYNLSGPAVCTVCGEEILTDCGHDASWTICTDCSGIWKCAHCGEWHYDEGNYLDDDAGPYCDYCYENYIDECELCGAKVHNVCQVFIHLLDDAPSPELESCNWGWVINACDDCLVNNTLRLIAREDMWGRRRNTVNLDDLDDERLLAGAIDMETGAQFIRIRDEKDRQKRIELIKKYFF